MTDTEVKAIHQLREELLELKKNSQLCTPQDLVERTRLKFPDLAVERLEELAPRVCENAQAMRSADEWEALEANDEAFDWHCRYLIATEGIEAIDPWTRHGYQEYKQIKSEVDWARLMEKAKEINDKYGVEGESQWPPAAWDEYARFALSLGYTRENMHRPWERGLTG